ncbi:MAG: hypothetical protein OSA48_12015, partial [Akkermansiaceae bacterium]|nr:hypothetical protein [Akkermansiaceae bacterium]
MAHTDHPRRCLRLNPELKTSILIAILSITRKGSLPIPYFNEQGRANKKKTAQQVENGMGNPHHP